MIIQELKIQNFRNLSLSVLQFSSGFNYIYGINGSGKSSLLEAVGLFGLGRSFRSSGWRQMLQPDQSFYRLEARCDYKNIAQQHLIYRDLAMKQQQLRMDNEDIKSIAEFVYHFPVQLVHPESGLLITEGPNERRRYLDWGAFHVKRNIYINAWRQYNQIITQRNTLIRLGKKNKELFLFDDMLCEYSSIIDKERENYFLTLCDFCYKILSIFFEDYTFELQYYPGWDNSKLLKDVLTLTLESDVRRGYTYAGSHRADIKLRVQGRDVAKVLSRGQQKLLVYALRLAQGQTLQFMTDKCVIYIFDDLAAELDPENLQKVLTLLGELGCQVFISGIEENSPVIRHIVDFDLKQFHVERGHIKEVV